VKIILAPDSFKESLSSIQICQAMERGIRNVLPNAKVIHLPLADGGEGTVDTLVAATSGSFISQNIIGPLGDTVCATFGLLGDKETAVIEMAAASGLPLVPLEKRNPLLTTTFGTGQLIKAALDLNVKSIIIGIGGSATNDCGAGMAQALGVKFFENSSAISAYMTGNLLERVTEIDMTDLDPRIENVHIQVACDVDNPLLGDHGVSKVYSPQKGASPQIVEQLEKNIKRIIDLIEAKTFPVRDIPGAGAAGGLGAGLLAFCHAELQSGIDIILDAVQFDSLIQDTDLILTGEGKIDAQSAMGKTIDGVLHRAQKYKIPVIAIGGAIADGAEELYNKGLISMFSICDRPMELSVAFKRTAILVEKITSQIVRVFHSN